MNKTRLPLWLALCALIATAHEGGRKDLKPTQAKRDLEAARKLLQSAKKKLAAQGIYSCCVKPTCDLCARVNGSCNCAANVASGRGACGECYGRWQAGGGAVKGVKAKSVKLLPAEHQACPRPANAQQPPSPPELQQAADALLKAQRTLVAEKRYACCIRGGCGQCAHEANCPCGADLAASRQGVCSDCFDRWRSGQGAFAGIDPAEVKLAPMESMLDSMGPGGGESSGWYSSGTSQIPRAAPMDMLNFRRGPWNFMLNGEMFGVYTDQTGPRGRDKIFSTNWLMAMASKRTGPGVLTLRSMLSLEPATITSGRYPLLFATGETFNGVPIINGQHPHDFFMELAAQYQLRLGERTSLTLYGGPRGEPALGPTAYPHRASSSEDPVAVISHHLQDSTHISNTVATLGITHGPVSLEASGFHGREPDEQRWGLEGGGIDSFSTRLTLTPTTRWSGQVSIGRLNRREATHPQRPSLRSTASLMYLRPLARGHWATSLVWGRNNDLSYTQTPNLSLLPRVTGLKPLHIVSVPTRIPREIYNSYLAESTVKLGHNWFWVRAESADKDSTLLYNEDPFVLLIDERRYARVQAYTAGYERELPRPTNWLGAGIGGQFTIYHAPEDLAPVYGSKPVGVQLFFRLRLGRPD